MPYLVMGLATGTGAPTPNTNLLVHSDTTNGNTTFIDSSPGALTLTTIGDAEHSTDQAKFGGTSIKFPGTQGAIKTETNAGFAVGTGDFTIDFWIYRTGDLNTTGLVSCMGFVGGAEGAIDGPGVLCTGNDPDGVYAYIGADSNFDGPFTVGTLPLNTWTHIAWIRASNVLYSAFNGTVTNHGANSRDIDVEGLAIGARYFTAPGVEYLQNAYMDEVRFSKVAEWTSNFTPPTAPYA